jgi:hypothetical protein
VVVVVALAAVPARGVVGVVAVAAAVADVVLTAVPGKMAPRRWTYGVTVLQVLMQRVPAAVGPPVGLVEAGTRTVCRISTEGSSTPQPLVAELAVAGVVALVVTAVIATATVGAGLVLISGVVAAVAPAVVRVVVGAGAVGQVGGFP